MECYNEEELLYLSRQGCDIAENALYDWCFRYVEKIILSLHIYLKDSSEQLDLYQSCWVLCVKAIQSYRDDRECMLKTFLGTVIKNHIFSVTKKHCLEKERFYDCSINLDEVNQYGYCNEAVIEDPKETYQPIVQLIVKEETVYYDNQIEMQCSPLEKQVIAAKLDGYMQWEIAKYLGVDVKVVYNALYRLQKKLGSYKSD